MRKKICMTALIMLTLAGCQHGAQADKFKKQVERENKKFPIRIAPDITVDSVCYETDRNLLTYHYTLSGELDNDTLIHKNYAPLYQQLREAVDNETELEEFRQSGTTFKYIYHSAYDGRQLAEFMFVNSPKPSDSNRQP